MMLRATCNHVHATRSLHRIPLRPRRRDVTRRMLVTGGTGYLGRVLVPAAARAGWDVTSVGSADGDIRNRRAVDAIVRTVEPDVIVHTAYTRRRADRPGRDGRRHGARRQRRRRPGCPPVAHLDGRRVRRPGRPDLPASPTGCVP